MTSDGSRDEKDDDENISRVAMNTDGEASQPLQPQQRKRMMARKKV